MGIAALLVASAEVPLRRARVAWLEGDLTRARRILERSAPYVVRRTARRHALAAVLLANGDERRAAPLLTGQTRFPLLEKGEIGERLVRHGLYSEFLAYDRAVREPDTSETALYRSAALLATGRTTEARRALDEIVEAEVPPHALAALRASVAERMAGTFPFVRDRFGRPLATYSTADADLMPLEESSSAFIDRSGGALTIESHLGELGTANTLRTTIHPAFQRAAAGAIAGFRGSLVAIDVRTNEILAIANASPDAAAENLAFRPGYEPGSIVKVLTMLTAADSGVDPRTAFPMPCEGFLVLSGRQFYDWARHDTLDDVNEALAVSCNVAFGRMGLRLGAGKLRNAMRAYGFGQSADLGLFTVALGQNVGELKDDHDVASYAVGLERERISPLHIAMLAAALANGGVMTDPLLLAGRRTVLGEEPREERARRSHRIATPEAARLAVEAMEAVVTQERGTGRRAAVQGLRIAMKTGTAGDAAGGYDSVIMAFAPADHPRVAIGMIAEDAGPAEFAGAHIAHDFFAAVLPLLGL